MPDAEIEAYRKNDPDRKPGIGMIQKSCQQFPEIDLAQSYIIGDKATDVEFAKNAGCLGVLLKTGYGLQVLDGSYQKLVVEPDWICDDLPQAINQILEAHLVQKTLFSSTLKQH